MKEHSIQIYVQPLTQLLPQSRSDFAGLSAFNHYKKQTIHQHRQNLISAYLSMPLQPDDFARTDFGKPYLAGFAEVAFNHSHSQQHYALALSRQLQDLGVDIEDLSRKVRFDALAQHAFDAEEYQHWKASNEEPSYWFKVWTCKEAVLKASGLGIRMSLNQLHTQCHPTQARGICQHPDLGVFAYQHLYFAQAMLTVAWRVEAVGVGQDLVFPEIEIIEP